MDQKKHDIVIVGSGMVGLCLANLLAELPLSIAIIEAHDIPEWSDDDYSLRVSAISAASQQTLHKAGAWSQIESSRISPYTDMQIWEQDAEGQDVLHFSANDLGVESLGCIVENDLIRQSLYVKVNEKKNITQYLPDRLDEISISEKSAVLQLSSGNRIEAKLVIAADGANSVTRRKLGLSEVSRSYEQAGVVTQLRTEKPHRHTAYQRFHKGQVLGLLPLANGNCSMVWSCETSEAERLVNLSSDKLGEALTEFSQALLGDIEVIGAVKKFDLKLMHSNQYVAERIVLCGDAAHAVHPLAGQGVNLGLLDAAVLSDVLTQAWQKNYDLGDLSVLRQYERRRKANNVQMMSALDTLYGLFQSDNPLLQQIRRFGMGIVDRITPLKKILIEQALGQKNL